MSEKIKTEELRVEKLGKVHEEIIRCFQSYEKELTSKPVKPKKFKTPIGLPELPSFEKALPSLPKLPKIQ